MEERLRDRIMGPHAKDHIEMTLSSNYNNEMLVSMPLKDSNVTSPSPSPPEFSFLRNALGRIPQILADDVLGELDKVRKQTSVNYFHQMHRYLQPGLPTQPRLSLRFGKLLK